MPRRQNVGVQAGSAILPTLKALQNIAGSTLKDVHTLRADLDYVKSSLLAYINNNVDRVANETKADVERLLATYKKTMEKQLAQQKQTYESHSKEQLESAMNQLNSHHNKEMQELQEELEKLRQEYNEDLDSWQRQCYYYKRSASSLRGEADRLRSILQRNKIKIPSSAVSRPLQVHDEARLLEDLQSTEKSLASARHDVKSLSLEKRRLEFLLRAVRAKAGEQLRIAEAVNEQLQNELSESRETLRQVQELSLRGEKGHVQMLRMKLEREFKQKARIQLAKELKLANERAQTDRESLIVEHERTIKHVHETHQKQLEELRLIHQEHLAKKDLEQKEVIEMLNKNWRRKLVITQKSLQTFSNSDAVAALTARQAKLLELSAKYAPRLQSND